MIKRLNYHYFMLFVFKRAADLSQKLDRVGNARPLGCEGRSRPRGASIISRHISQFKKHFHPARNNVVGVREPYEVVKLAMADVLDV
jgi:hypothetical protein